MNKPYGNRGKIENFPFNDLRETIYSSDSLEIEISEGTLSVGVDDESNLQEANKIAKIWLNAWSLRQNIKTKIIFNHRWVTQGDGSKMHYLEIKETLTPIGRIYLDKVTPQENIQAKVQITNQKIFDSASFTPDLDIVNKALNNDALRSALHYFNDEVVDDDRPLYGIFKSIEAITKYLKKNGAKKGREELARIVGEEPKFVNDVMETANASRHHEDKNSRVLLSEKECRNRAVVLIRAFARSLP